MSNSYLEDHQWQSLYETLVALMRGYVRGQHLASWRGQEDDIAEDIAQDTLLRLYILYKKIERGEAKPILSLTALSRTIATNYARDLCRKDKRMIRPQQDEESGESELWLYDDENQPDEIVEQVSTMVSLSVAVSVIADLATKQQISVITDLAKYTHFEEGEERTPLEQAFDEVGINFRAYRHLLPVDPLLKGRHAASLSIGYKKVREQTLAILREIGLVS